MQNLTSNAIKALKDQPAGAVEWTAEKEGDKTMFAIADNGPGIGSEQANLLYTDSVSENSRDGFGLHLVRDPARAI